MFTSITSLIVNWPHLCCIYGCNIHKWCLCNYLSLFKRCDWAFNTIRILWARNCSIWHTNNALWFVWSGKMDFSLSLLFCWCSSLKYLECHVHWTVEQEKKYTERVMLLYDGLHYDALAVCSPDFLVLIFTFLFSDDQMISKTSFFNNEFHFLCNLDFSIWWGTRRVWSNNFLCQWFNSNCWKPSSETCSGRKQVRVLYASPDLEIA